MCCDCKTTIKLIFVKPSSHTVNKANGAFKIKSVGKNKIG